MEFKMNTTPGFVPEFTIYSSIKEPKNGRSENSLEKVISLLSGDDESVKEKTRNIQHFNKKEVAPKSRKCRDGWKRSLPVACFNGVFSNRSKNGFKKHSGLMVLDYDKYENREKMMMEFEKFKNIPTTFLAFISPSGLGIKVLVRISKETTVEQHTLKF